MKVTRLLSHLFHSYSQFYLQDNYNALHIASMYSREDVVKLLLNKRGVDPYSTGGVSILSYEVTYVCMLYW